MARNGKGSGGIVVRGGVSVARSIGTGLGAGGSRMIRVATERATGLDPALPVGIAAALLTVVSGGRGLGNAIGSAVLDSIAADVSTVGGDALGAWIGDFIAEKLPGLNPGKARPEISAAPEAPAVADSAGAN